MPPGHALGDLTSLATVDGSADELFVQDASAAVGSRSKRATAGAVVVGGLGALSASGSTASTDRLARYDGTTSTVEAVAEAGVIAAADTVTPAAADTALFVQGGALKKAAISSVVDKGVVAAGAAAAVTPGTDKLAIVQSGALALGTVQAIVDAAVLAVLTTQGDLLTRNGSNALARIATGASGTALLGGTTPAWSSIAQVLGMAPPIGLELIYLSATTFRARSGSYRTRDGLTLLTLAADTTVDITTTGSAGMDRKTLTGTISGTSGTKNVTGSGTVFLTDFGRRVLTGTFSNGGGTTTITGTNADPRAGARIGKGDLIGNDTIGYRRVTNRNFSLGAAGASCTITVNSAHASFSGSTLYVIETPTFSFGSERHAVDTITSDTALTTIDNLASSPSGVAGYTGDRYPSRTFYVHLLGDGTLRLSTQRTTAFASATSRRIGAAWLDSSSQLIENFGWREGSIFFVVLPQTTNTSTTTESTPVRLMTEVEAFIADAVIRNCLVYISISNGATNDTNVIGIVMPGSTLLGTWTSLAQTRAGNVDNAEHAMISAATQRFPDIWGDGAFYVQINRSAGSGGTATMIVDTHSAGFEL